MGLASPKITQVAASRAGGVNSKVARYGEVCKWEVEAEPVVQEVVGRAGGDDDHLSIIVFEHSDCRKELESPEALVGIASGKK